MSAGRQKKISKKCLYCGKSLQADADFCNQYCQTNYEIKVFSEQKKIKYFIIGLLLGFLGIILGVGFDTNLLLIGGSIVLMGIVIVIFPFTTPETTEMFGYLRSRKIGRLAGVLVGIIGVWVAFF